MPSYPTWHEGLDGPELEGGTACRNVKLQDCESQKNCYIRKAYKRSNCEPVRAACVKGKHSAGKEDREGEPLNIEDLVSLPELVGLMKMQMRFPNLKISASKLQRLQKFADVEPIKYKFIRAHDCPASYPREKTPDEVSVDDIKRHGVLAVNASGNLCLKNE